MDSDILHLWSLNRIELIILNLALIAPVILYCITKISHYNEILPTKKGKAFSYLVFILFGTAYALISYMFLMPYIAFPIGVLVLFLMLKACYHISLMQGLFFANDFILIPLLAGSITVNLSSVIFAKPLSMIPEYWVVFEPVFAFIVASAISYYLYRKKIIFEHWHTFIENNKHLNGIIAVQSYFILICVVITIIYDKEVTIWFSVVSLMLLIGSVVVYLILIDYVVRVSSISIYEKDKQILEEQLKLQMSNYNNQIEYVQEVRKFKHDFVPLLSTVNALIKQGKTAEAATLLEQAENIKTTYFNSYQEFSNNLFIQAIMNNAYHESLNKNIKLSGKILFPNELVIEDIDLCRIFTNLIKNAMEACAYIDENKRIEIEGHAKNNWFVLTVSNSFDGKVNMQDGKIITRKKDKVKHSFGLHILLETVEKYGGFVKTNWTEEMWYTKVYLPF